MAAMANKMRTHSPTNEWWTSFGEAQGEQKEFLSSLTTEHRRMRRQWQHTLHNTPLRSGPYPLYRRQYGWMKVYLDQKIHQACYVPRGDLNIDADIYRVEYHADGTVKARHKIPDQTTKIKSRFCQEIFNTETDKFEVGSESVTTMLTVQEAKEMLRNEEGNWKKYDESLEKERQHQKTRAASNILASIQGPRQRRKPAQFELLGPFVEGPNNKRLQKKAQVAKAQVEKAQVEKPQNSRVKRRLPFTDEKQSKVPRLRFVTKLDKVKEAHGKSSKGVQKIVWAQAKLEDKKAWMKTLSKKPERIASIIFDVLPKKDVVDIALQLVAHCAQDALEEALERYRLPALQKINEKMGKKCEELIELTAQMKKVQAQTTAPAVVVNLAELEVDGPDEVGGPDEVDGPDEVGGPDKVDGPEVVNLVEDHGPSNTPAFVKREYWITSAKASSGYKGVNKCKGRGGWRAKAEGRTIGRFDTKHEACEAYYNYCKRYGLL